MNTNLLKLDMTLPISSLEAYIQRVNEIPMLSSQEEKELAEQYWEHQDLEEQMKRQPKEVQL
jgi:RNA polymerase sigma-32 factor